MNKFIMILKIKEQNTIVELPFEFISDKSKTDIITDLWDTANKCVLENGEFHPYYEQGYFARYGLKIENINFLENKIKRIPTVLTIDEWFSRSE